MPCLRAVYAVLEGSLHALRAQLCCKQADLMLQSWLVTPISERCFDAALVCPPCCDFSKHLQTPVQGYASKTE